MSLNPFIGVAVLTCLLGVSSCVHYHAIKYSNGQLTHYGEKANGVRAGIWVYFTEQGDIERDVLASADRPFNTRTGYYINGVKARELTDQEMRIGIASAQRLAEMTGGKLLKTFP